jgi:predicted PurR-regulated permease PerM
MEQNATTQPQHWPPSRVILATLIVLAVAGSFWLLFEFRLVFFSLFVAIVLSTALRPIVNRLAKVGISRSVSILLISLILLALLVGFILVLVPLISEQWATITTLLSEWYQGLRSAMVESPSLIVRRIARQLPVFLPLTLPAVPVDRTTGETDPDLVAQVWGLLTGFLRGLLLLVGVALLTGFWTLEGDRAIRFMLAAVPQNQRESVREFINEVQDRIGAYTIGLVLLSTIIGVMSFIAYTIIGLPNAILLATIAGVMEAVPLIGPLLGAIPAIIVAAAYDSSKVIWVIVATIIIQLSENNLIVPRLMKKAVGVNPVASLMAFIAFGSIFGLFGALLAIPLAALLQIILRRWLFDSAMPEQSPLIGRDAVSMLRYEAQELIIDVRKRIRAKEAEPEESTDLVEDAVEAIAQDLDSILAQVESDHSSGDGQK